jgi:hypothetical protein
MRERVMQVEIGPLSTEGILEAARALVERLDGTPATRAVGVIQQSTEAAQLREALGLEQPRFCRSECCASYAAEVTT